MTSPFNSDNRFNQRKVGAPPDKARWNRRARRPLHTGEKPQPAGQQVLPWYLRFLDVRVYLRLAIALVAVGAVVMMTLIGREHLVQQLSSRNEPVEGLVRPGQTAGEALSLDNLEDTLLGLYLRIQEPVLAAAPGDSDQVVPFTIESGEPARSVADRLAEMGLVTDPGLFALYMRYNGLDQGIEAGDFELAYNMAMPEIAQLLQRAIVREVTVTVPEGWRAEQVAELLDEQGIIDSDNFMAAVRSGDPAALGLGQYSFLTGRRVGNSLEGYLFPDTYRVPSRAPRRPTC